MINLSKRQKDILIGTLLGDSCLEFTGKNARLKIDHSVSQAQLTNWVYQEFKDFCSKEPYFLSEFDRRMNKSYYHYRFSTISNPKFNLFYSKFYQLKRKIVPEDIRLLLTNPLSLAVWYMDDGFRRRDCNGIYLCTSAFNAKEQLLLIEMLKMNFDIDARVHYAAGNARMYIPSGYANKFCQLVKDFILPDLSYKLL